MQYKKEVNGVKQTMNVTGTSVTEATISNVESSTNYSIKVAAINRVGTGVYSPAVTVITHESKPIYHTSSLTDTLFIRCVSNSE